MPKKQEHCSTVTDQKHGEVLPLVNRIGGQISGIGKMVEEGRYCPDILNQVRAARAALRTLEARILRTHLQSCVHEAFLSDDENAKNDKIDEIVSLFCKYDEVKG